MGRGCITFVKRLQESGSALEHHSDVVVLGYLCNPLANTGYIRNEGCQRLIRLVYVVLIIMLSMGW